MNKSINPLVVLIICLLLFGCEFNKNQKRSKDTTDGQKTKIATIDKQLNITILLDLSDRIEPTKYPVSPEHHIRDIEVVNYFTELFKTDMEKKGAFMAKGKIKVIFSPRPSDPEINNIASDLLIDLTKTVNNKEKKKIHDNISDKFRNNLELIYEKTIETKEYPGSDIWRFFKNDVLDYCVSKEENYRNILVILTDGYIYHKNSMDTKENRSAYLLPRSISQNGFNNDSWKEKFDSDDYGYIATRNDLQDLEILVLEISPIPSSVDDEDIIKAYLGKWFQEMGVKRFMLFNTDLPEYTKSRIESFMLAN